MTLVAHFMANHIKISAQSVGFGPSFRRSIHASGDTVDNPALTSTHTFAMLRRV